MLQRLPSQGVTIAEAWNCVCVLTAGSFAQSCFSIIDFARSRDAIFDLVGKPSLSGVSTSKVIFVAAKAALQIS